MPMKEKPMDKAEARIALLEDRVEALDLALVVRIKDHADIRELLKNWEPDLPQGFVLGLSIILERRADG